jgi:2-polyprenyl-3-methyl-5-hydroxy-6-metoxy-1,4-benzoquinol methylase
MKLNTKYRTLDPEIMDDFSLTGETLREALDKISSINKWLGGNRLIIKSIEELIKNKQFSAPITIVDVGCGNGDMLRAIADYAKQNHLKVKLIGIDANAFTIDYAIKCSATYAEISYLCLDIFSEEFKAIKYDYLLCTLTLHHFSNQEISDLLNLFYKNAAFGVVINDLQRSKLAYRLFQLVAVVFNLNDMNRKDGLTSILRGFKKSELLAFTRSLNPTTYKLSWQWAFRYQLLLIKK